MALPKIRERLPGKQSLAARLRANIMNHDLVRVFGPTGASARVTHPGSPERPLGQGPRTDQWNDNPLVSEESTAPAARPSKGDRARGHLVK